MEVKDICRWQEAEMSHLENKIVNSALAEVSEIVSEVDGPSIKNWYLEKGTASMTGISKAVNHLILDGLIDRGWAAPLRFFDLRSQQATFEAGKTFSGGNREISIGLDLGSRHRQSSLAYLLRPTLANLQDGNQSEHVDAGFILAFTNETIEWGMWNKANSTYESLSSEYDLASPLVMAPTYLLGIDPSADLVVSKNLDYGTLSLDLV